MRLFDESSGWDSMRKDLRFTASALAQFAAEHELPRDYPDAFFPSAPTTRAKAAKTPATPKGPPSA